MGFVSFSEHVSSVSDAMKFVTRAAPDQGGVISGINPVAFTTADPIRLWVIQVVIIIITAQLLGLILGRMRQPRVIAEVIGGVILGPTIMGRIPNFSNTIFPATSLFYLNLTATIGLVLFLFLTALEVDVRIIKRNAKSSIAISLAGILLPFGMGAGVAVPIYHNYVDQNVKFGYFLLFTGVAMSITAFPVLCRILTELKLLDTNVGVTTLAAGVGNDVVGWILLALTVALVNASGGLTALYVFLAAVAWTLFVLYPVKWVYRRLAIFTGSIENGTPTPFMMITTFIVIFISAFMTDILGVHAIFGGFVAGLIIPHDNGYAISLVEKLEDLVTLLFIPLYFAYSGLNTNLGLLNTGKIWGYIVLLCTVAFIGKFTGCAIAARLSKFNWRESATIGVLMSCKGLVELIVLNIGFQAKILDQRLFSAFVVMALVLTFMTTPITLAIYPPKHRVQHIHAAAKKDTEDRGHRQALEDEGGFKSRFSVVLNKIEHLPAIMTLTQLLQSTSSVTLATSESSAAEGAGKKSSKTVVLDALRLIELTERTSAVMQSSEADDIIHRDALLSILRTFGLLNSIPVSTSLSVVSHESFSNTVASHVREKSSELVILPWNSSVDEQSTTSNYNPFEGIFGAGKASTSERSSSAIYSQFIRRVFATAPTDVALFVDRGLSPINQINHGQHILFPFFGGPDDRLALSFVIQLCANPSITATVLRIRKIENDNLTPTDTQETDIKTPQGILANLTVMSNSGFPDTIYAPPDTQTRMESANEDNLLLSRFSGSNRQSLSATFETALTRVTFEELETAQPLHALVQRSNEERANLEKNLLIVTGRGRRMADSNHAELRTLIQENQGKGTVGGEMSRTVGDVATALMIGVKASVLVMQAALPSIKEE